MGAKIMDDIMERISEFGEARRKGFLTVKNLKDDGKKVVGVYCGFAPWEIIAASGAVSAWLCGMDEEPILDAEKHLPRNLCPLIKSSYGFAITGKCPYFYFSDMLIGETTCDGKKKMYEYLGNMKPMHVMNLPQTTKGEESRILYRNELIALKENLEKTLNVTIEDEDIREKIIVRNRERKAIREFYELGKLDPPPLWGLEMRKVLEATKYIADKEVEIENIEKLVKDVKEKYNSGERKVSVDAKRILVTGSPLGEPTEKVIRLIEESGGVVVCFENCGSAKNVDDLVDENIDPMDALVERYLNTACACMSPNDNRAKMIAHFIDEYNIDGVVEMILQACHTYNVETYRIKRIATEQKNTPYLCVETDYSQKDMGQLRTRIAAFMEML